VTGDDDLSRRAARPWDWTAKYQRAREIALGEALAAGRAHNNMGDAMRHARWSQRTADKSGALFSLAFGAAHELENLSDSLRKDWRGREPYETGRRDPTPAQTLDESLMDMRNNLEGIKASLRDRAIDTRRLQTRPQTEPACSLYHRPRDRLSGLPPR
jgi:hypothetical protein